jgi:hypothetical protein
MPFPELLNLDLRRQTILTVAWVSHPRQKGLTSVSAHPWHKTIYGQLIVLE